MLAQAGELDHTLILVVADHGESFREHGYKHHNFSPFNEELKVPFFMVHPDFSQSKVSDLDLGSHLDIFPTLLDMTGAKHNGSLHGVSLFNQETPRKIYANSWTKAINITSISSQTKYIYNTLQDVVVRYDWRKDPNEKKPVKISATEAAKIKEELLQSRLSILASHNKNHILLVK